MSAIANALRNAAGKTGDHSLLDAIGKADARIAQQKAVKKPVKSHPKPPVQFGKAKEVVVNGHKPETKPAKKHATGKPLASAKKSLPQNLKRGESTTVKANTGKGPKSQVSVKVANKGSGKIEVTTKPAPARKAPAKKAEATSTKPPVKKSAPATPHPKAAVKPKSTDTKGEAVPHKTIAEAKKDAQQAPVKDTLTDRGLEKLKAHTKQKPQQSKTNTKPAAQAATSPTEKKA